MALFIDSNFFKLQLDVLLFALLQLYLFSDPISSTLKFSLATEYSPKTSISQNKKSEMPPPTPLISRKKHETIQGFTTCLASLISMKNRDKSSSREREREREKVKVLRRVPNVIDQTSVMKFQLEQYLVQ